jgi:methyl-galactoside transport system substrate-binding protein
MDTNLVTYNEANKNMIELVICNNDGMAEGVVASLQQAGYNKPGAHTVPVFGVDATDAAKALIREGAMVGTVKQDADGMAAAIRQTVRAVMDGKSPAEALASLTDSRFVVDSASPATMYVSYAPYTGE